MTKRLEEMITESVAKGDFTHLSVIATADGKFSASFAPAKQFGISIATADDPLSALRNALSAVRTRPRKVSKPNELDAAEPADDMDFG